MRPVANEFQVSQPFASMPTAGVRADYRPSSGVGYYVYLYGNYQPFGHAGMDFATPIGTPVRAIADGVVLYAGWGYNLPGSGNIRKWLFYKDFPGILTVIQHDGWISAYAHLSDNDAAPAGTPVKEGQLIGLSGNTGGVAPHLHVEALVDLSYRTGGGLIYGRTDPSKYFGSINYQGTITSEDEELTPAQMHELKVFIQEDNERRHLATRDTVVTETNKQAVVTRNEVKDEIKAEIKAAINEAVFNLRTEIQATADVDRQYIPDRINEKDGK